MSLWANTSIAPKDRHLRASVTDSFVPCRLMLRGRETIRDVRSPGDDVTAAFGLALIWGDSLKATFRTIFLVN